MKARSGCFLASSATRSSLVEMLPEFSDSDIVPSFGSMSRTLFPSAGSSWGEFPGIVGTVRVSDFSPSIPRRFVSFAPRCIVCSPMVRVPVGSCARGVRRAQASGFGCGLPGSASGRGDDEISQVPGAPPRACPALRPRWSLGAHDPRVLRRGLPQSVRRRPPRLLTFGAPSHGPHARCLRFAAGLTDGHARLASGW